MSHEGENYIEAIDGNDIVLTIDATIQGIAEKYLKEACIDNVCTDGGNIIIMNPKNGDILAMAGYPNYNLNSPYEPTTDDMKKCGILYHKQIKLKICKQCGEIKQYRILMNLDLHLNL